jgi:hypothetical protein
MISALNFFCFGDPFLTGLPFRNDRVIPKRVIQWKEYLTTIKERDFLVVLQPKYICVIQTYWTIQLTVDTQTGKFAICQIIMD